MGPNETEYKKYWPELDDGDAKVVRRYPNHREFVFEQLLKIKYNIGEYKLSKNSNFNPNAPMTATSPLFFVFMCIATALILLVMFIT